MLPNTYQSGNFIELFNAQNKDLVKFWKYSGKITKEFDSGVKGFINILHSGGLSKMQIPDSDKNSLGIVQSYIVFQVFIFSSKLFNIEIGFTDTSKTKRRLFFSNSSKEIASNPFHCRVPLLNIPMATWVNISIDVLSFVSECFKASTFRSIDYISISANCKLRRIFSMRNSLNETNKNLISDDLTLDFYELLPKNLSLPQNVNFNNYNFTYEKIRFELDEIKMQEINSGNSVNSTNNFNNNNSNAKDSNSNNFNNHENNNNNNNNNRNNNVLSPNRRKQNENGKHESNSKNFKSNLNKLKNFDINSVIGNYNTNNPSNNNNQNNANKINNNNNNENASNQTNGISNSSNNNTNSNGLTGKNPRAKSYSRINKFGKNPAANQTNISSSNNENHNVNINKSPKGEGNLLKEKNELKSIGNNNNNKNENLKKNLFEKNKNKIKYNIPTKINKFLNNKSNNNNNLKSNGAGINNKKVEVSGSLRNSSAGGNTKADTNNHSEKNKSDNGNINIKLNKQSNGLSKNNNEYDYKSNSLLLNTLNYRNIDKWENSKDNGGDSIEEIYEIEERNINGKSMRKYSNNSPDKNNNNHNAEGVQRPINHLNNAINKSMNNPDNNLDRDENEELEDKFYYDIPIKDFKKKSQFKESGNYFTLNKNKDAEMTPQNQTQNNLNHFYQNNLNTITNSNKSNYNTNNQFNFSKNNNMNLISNFQNNLNNANSTNLNSNHELNKDKNKREIIEEILRDTSSGSFFARIDRERPFTPPFTKLVPMSSLEKINSSAIEYKDFNPLNNPSNNVNLSHVLNADLVNSKLENLQHSQFLNANNALNNSVQLNLNSNNALNANNLNGSKIDEVTGVNSKLNPNVNESKMHEISYRIKDINYMDLIYDHVMGHYYDPKSNIYYELKNIGNANQIEIE